MESLDADVGKEFNVAEFQSLLRTKYIGRNLLYRRETDSTMRVAAEQSADGAPEGTLIIADHQTKGRGRVEGRTWESGECQNLLFTIIFKRGEVGVNNKEPLKLALAAPAAVAYVGRKVGVDTWTKWPNDVWIGAKKACGFMALSPQANVQNVGIGINVNENFDQGHARFHEARSFRDALGYPLSRERILASVCNRMEFLLTNKSFNELVDEYLAYDRLLGRTVKVMPHGKENTDTYEAQVVGVNEWGNLKVVAGGGNELALTAQEVTIRLTDAPTYESRLVIKNTVDSVITGEWGNELGSRVTFEAHTDGRLTGIYRTAVGNAVFAPLNGGWGSVDDEDGGALIGWTVVWNTVKPKINPISVTSWSGRLYVIDAKPPEIQTTWLLTSELPRTDLWKSTLVNRDVFTKIPK